MSDDLNSAPAEEVLKGLHVRRTPYGLRIVYRWRSGLGGARGAIGEGVLFLIGLGFFAVPLVSLSAMLSRPADVPAWQPLIALPFILLGACIVYRGLGLVCNSSVFEVSRQELKARHGPLPLLSKNFTIPAGEIVKVDWQKVGHTSRSDGSGVRRSGYSATFDVRVVTAGGRTEKLMSGLNGREYAFAVQNELSRFLNPR